MPVYPINYALGGKRANTFRCGYLSAKIFCYVDGVEKKISDLSITERNGVAATASFTASGSWEPQGGEEVVIKQGTPNRIGLMFGGMILAPTATNFQKPENRHVSARVIDWTWALSGDLVMGRFTGTYDEIALELMARHAPAGFTTRRVQRGLPTVSNGIEFTDVYLPVALERLAKRGGYLQFLGYGRDLYFRDDGKLLSAPATVTATNKTLKRQSFRLVDYGQLVTRLYFECQGSQALAEVVSGESIVPLVDVSNFPATGGLAKSGTQRFAFDRVSVGGGGSLVGPGAKPSSAPNLTLAAGSGVTVGAHDVAIAFETASGISLPGQRASITVGTVAAPSSAATAGTPSNGGSMDAGSHRYYPVFRTAAGSTTAGPVSNAVMAATPQSAPGGVIAAAGGFGFPSSIGSGTYYYKSAWRRITDGALTDLSGASSAVGVSAGEPQFDPVRINPDTPPSGYAFVVYRTYADAGASSTYREVPGLFLHSGWLIDTNADGSLGAAAPSSNGTAKGTCAVTGIPASSSPLVTHVDMYREFNTAGASTAKLAFSVTNGTTSASDTAANSSLGATVPSSNTATAGQISMASIQIGGSGTTARLVYMTEADDPGGTLKLAATLSNNSDITLTLTTADGSLGAAAETVDGSGLAQPDGQVLPGDTSVPVAGTAPFRAAGGWAQTGTATFRYEGFSGTALTGVPPSGPGSIAQPISYNTTIAAAACLVGVSNGSPDLGSITYTIPRGQEVNPVAQLDNLDAQALVRTKVSGHSGIKAVALSNRSLSYNEAAARGQVYLDRRSQLVASGSIVTKDINIGSGSTVVIDLESPTNVNKTLFAQSVIINNFHPNPPVDPSTERPFDYQPDRTVELAAELTSLDDLVRQDARR